MEKKILHLTLKKKWFDMVASGEKKEEYREIKPYWVKRLFSDDVECNPTDYRSALTDMAEGYDHDHIYNVYGIWPQRFDIVRFKNGYAKNAPTIDVKCIEVTTGQAKPEWSDNWEGDVIVIKLGAIVSPTTNVTT